jgi:LexA-binding, inner membrane-associated putative hydrolase
MSLPLGHAAFALAAYDLTTNADQVSAFRQWKVLAVIVILSNLPDIDILLGLLYSGNGELFHRGPTHSLLFACFIAAFYVLGARKWKILPPLEFSYAFLLIGTHLFADYVFTDAPVSLFWPFELSLTPGFQGWGDVVHSIIFHTSNDITLILLCATVVIFKRIFRLDRIFCLLPVFVKKTNTKK